MHPIAEKVQAMFPDTFVRATEALGELAVFVKKEAVVPVCRFLSGDPVLAFDFLSDIFSVDYPSDPERFEVTYLLYSIRRHHRLKLKTRVTEADCRVDSVTGIWQGANFLEREVYDMMGIRFTGHPDLRRIMLPEEFEGWPLRKDFPTEGRGWRHTFPFLPTFEREG